MSDDLFCIVVMILLAIAGLYLMLRSLLKASGVDWVLTLIGFGLLLDGGVTSYWLYAAME